MAAETPRIAADSADSPRTPAQPVRCLRSCCKCKATQLACCMLATCLRSLQGPQSCTAVKMVWYMLCRLVCTQS